MRKIFIIGAISIYAGAANALSVNTGICSPYAAGATCYNGSSGSNFAIDNITFFIEPGCTLSTSGCTTHECTKIDRCVCAPSSYLCPSSVQTCPEECPNLSWTALSGNPKAETRCNSDYQCEYRCAAGYYGSGVNCTQCPSSGGITGTSVAGDNATITKCYIPSGTSFSDSTGSGTYTNNCYWTN